MSFEDYLISKKIESNAFKQSENGLWKKLKCLFEQMHPNSFTMQKLNLINGIRRNYPLQDVEEKKVEKAKPKRPIIRPKI